MILQHHHSGLFHVSQHQLASAWTVCQALHHHGVWGQGAKDVKAAHVNLDTFTRTCQVHSTSSAILVFSVATKA